MSSPHLLKGDAKIKSWHDENLKVFFYEIESLFLLRTPSKYISLTAGFFPKTGSRRIRHPYPQQLHAIALPCDPIAPGPMVPIW
jgi:hypothetical protein